MAAVLSGRRLLIVMSIFAAAFLTLHNLQVSLKQTMRVAASMSSTDSPYVHPRQDDGTTPPSSTTTANDTLPSPNGKPYFVIHVGPPKTATTTLQEELHRWNSVLRQQDNYTYAGKVLQRGKRRQKQSAIWKGLQLQCQEQVYQSRVSIILSNKNTTNTPICWKNFVQELQRLRGQSIVVSDEVYSFKWGNFGQDSLSPWDWVSLQEALAKEWNIKLVIAYRRLYEWLPSVKQQTDRWAPSKRALNHWPGDGGRAIQPLTEYLRQQPSVHPKSTVKASFLFTDQLLDKFKEQVSANVTAQLQILNVHDAVESESVRTTFLCHVLPTATRACATSRHDDQTTTQQTRSNPQQTVFYDVLVTAAAARGWIHIAHYKRHDVVLAAAQYQQKTLQLTDREFAMTCPTENELEALLHASLAAEAAVLPVHAARQQEEAHQHDFWTKRHRFCWIETDAVLALTEWKTFFAQFASNHTAVAVQLNKV
jgi:hypothetical protein